LADFLKELNLDNDVLKKMIKIYQRDIKLGLDEKTEKKSSLKCFITYVQDLPSGNATNTDSFRNKKTITDKGEMEAYKKSGGMQVAEGRDAKFFDYLAECLFEFTLENKVHNQNLPLGFTFGWPVEQRGLSIGILKQWTKGFNCSGVVGHNVGLIVNVAAVLNDTTGTLMSCAWKDPDCRIGLIIGAGTNCCYVERTERVKKFEGDPSKPFVIINTESGAFGDGGQIDFMRTDWDRELDADTLNPGRNVCEKMISNLYLGELVRRVLLTAATRGIIFSGRVSDRLGTSGAFDTNEVPGQYRTARAVLNEMGYPMPWAQDCTDLQYTCYMVWQRAGRIVSAEMAALLNYMDFSTVTIGVDGALYRSHPGFSELMHKTIRQLTKPEIKASFVRSDF
ncbi:Hexokinase type 2, partial [Gryllus bimaculatus]